MNKNIYFLHGADHFIIKTKTDQIVKSYNVDQFNTTTYDAEESNVADAINDASTIPFMSDLKIIIIKSAYFVSTYKPKKEINHNLDLLSRYLANPFETTILIISAPYPKLDERRAITKIIKKYAEVTQCEPMKVEDLRGWINRQLGNKNTRIDRDALEEFINRVAHNTAVAVNEMKKLLAYTEDIDHVTLEIIKRVITKSIEDNIFEISNAILAGNRSKALDSYHDLVEYGEDPIVVLGMLVKKYREILQVKLLQKEGKDKNGIADYYHVSSGRAYYMVKNAGTVNVDTVIHHLSRLEETDVSIKTGRIDKKIGLELFILGT
ncbi:MAG: DNA polymerase III subunit delta [Candidatus Izemoplasma sp.]